MTDITDIQVLDVEPKMILEIASGVRDPAEIAEQYGLSPGQWLELQAYDPFIRLVEDKKTELKASGWTFRMKSALIAEELLEDLYLKAMDKDASFHTVLETVKFTSRAAGLDAPAKEAGMAGSGFSIVINLGGGKSIQIGDGPRVIEHEDEVYGTETFREYSPTTI